VEVIFLQKELHSNCVKKSMVMIVREPLEHVVSESYLILQILKYVSFL
jgi:hypothetical protein